MALPSTGSSRSNGLIPGVARCRSMLQCTIKAYGSTKEVRLPSDQKQEKPDMEFVNIVHKMLFTCKDTIQICNLRCILGS